MRLELRDARKRFGALHALNGVSLVVEPGERVALVGPNGSGKSTLVRALLGLLACEGDVLLDGRSPYDDRLAIAHRLAYVPQVAPALHASVDEMLALVAQTRVLPLTDIAHVAGRFGLALADIGGQSFRTLSGGMKQKLLLSVAFAARPSLLVLDEPTASLDAAARAVFFSLCAGLDSDVTVLLCSHRAEELQRLVTRVVALADGRVAFDGDASRYLAQVDAAHAAAGVP